MVGGRPTGHPLTHRTRTALHHDRSHAIDWRMNSALVPLGEGAQHKSLYCTTGCAAVEGEEPLAVRPQANRRQRPARITTATASVRPAPD